MPEREYVITLKNTTSTGEKKPKVAGDNEEKKNPKKKNDDAIKGVGAMTAYSYGKAFIAQAVSHEVNMVELRTGATEYAQKVQYAWEVTQRVYSAAETIVSGAVVGGGVGAIIGIAVAGIREIVSLGQRAETLNTKRNLENESLARGLRRAGTNQSR